MSIHYKFKNTINYDAVKFDSVYISAADLKANIIQQKKLGHSELQVMNEETGTVYADHENIPKNTNIIVSRIPFANSNKRARLAANNHHSQDKHGSSSSSGSLNANGSGGGSSGLGGGSSGSGIGSVGSGGGREAMELVSTKDMSEEEKIKYIQSQSTKDFDPARYARGGGRGGHRGGRGNHHRPHFVPGPGYTCRKCGIPGHSIYDCKMSHMMKVKRSTGIPRDFLEKADSKEKGAVLTPSGEYAVHYLDREAYSNPKVEKPPFFEDTPSDITPTTQSSTSTTTNTVAVAASSESTSRAKRKNHHDDYSSSSNNNDY